MYSGTRVWGQAHWQSTTFVENSPDGRCGVKARQTQSWLATVAPGNAQSGRERGAGSQVNPLDGRAAHQMLIAISGLVCLAGGVVRWFPARQRRCVAIQSMARDTPASQMERGRRTPVQRPVQKSVPSIASCQAGGASAVELLCDLQHRRCRKPHGCCVGCMHRPGWKPGTRRPPRRAVRRPRTGRPGVARKSRACSTCSWKSVSNPIACIVQVKRGQPFQQQAGQGIVAWLGFSPTPAGAGVSRAVGAGMAGCAWCGHRCGAAPNLLS